MNEVISILVDFLIIGSSFIVWLFIAIYISKIKKYQYDNRYNYWWDKFKFTWIIIMYISLIFSFFLINEVFEQEFISRFVLFVILSIITIMISIVLFLRTTHKCEGIEKNFKTFYASRVDLIRKAIKITNILMLLYYLMFFIFITM